MKKGRKPLFLYEFDLRAILLLEPRIGFGDEGNIDLFGYLGFIEVPLIHSHADGSHDKKTDEHKKYASSKTCRPKFNEAEEKTSEEPRDQTSG